ncbi:MAG: LysE family translocator [Desulfobulbaceae bacterium]|nr:MAG: LysE family translocator [Desulfobulbaceae bacterium]
METQLLLFIAASLVVILTPGQDMLLVMSRAVSHGARAGVITATGVSLGLLGHSLLAAAGLGALLMASKSLFLILKTVGACYLFYLGIKLIRSHRKGIELTGNNHQSYRRMFVTGAFSNISNPHITIFYFAFLPQFIPTDATHPTTLLFALGVSFSILTFMVKGPVGYFAGALSNWFRQHPSVLKWVDRVSGIMLIGLGVRLVTGER